MAIRVFELAKELRVTSKAVLDKSRDEGLEIKNHITTLSADFEATIREWFSESARASAVEVTDHVNLEAEKKKRARSRRRRGEGAGEATAVTEAPAVGTEELEAPTLEPGVAEPPAEEAVAGARIAPAETAPGVAALPLPIASPQCVLETVPVPAVSVPPLRLSDRAPKTTAIRPRPEASFGGREQSDYEMFEKSLASAKKHHNLASNDLTSGHFTSGFTNARIAGEAICRELYRRAFPESSLDHSLTLGRMIGSLRTHMRGHGNRLLLISLTTINDHAKLYLHSNDCQPNRESLEVCVAAVSRAIELFAREYGKEEPRI